MDSWSPLQMEKMKAGGNARFLAYLQKQKFPKNLPHEQKYDSKACENYRDHISSVSRGESGQDLPFVGFQKKSQTNGVGDRISVTDQHIRCVSLLVIVPFAVLRAAGMSCDK